MTQKGKGGKPNKVQEESKKTGQPNNTTTHPTKNATGKNAVHITAPNQTTKNEYNEHLDSGGNTSSATTKKAINQIVESLHVDPRDDLFIKLDQEDIKGLVEYGMLQMNLLDYILHASCTIPKSNDGINYFLSSTIT